MYCKSINFKNIYNKPFQYWQYFNEIYCFPKLLYCFLEPLQDLSLHCRQKTFTGSNHLCPTFHLYIGLNVNSFYFTAWEYFSYASYKVSVISVKLGIHQWYLIWNILNYDYIYGYHSYIAQCKEHWHLSAIKVWILL